MENITTLAFSNQTQLPIQLISKSDPMQFWVMAAIAASGILFYLYFFVKETTIKDSIVQIKLKKLTGRPTLVINHQGEADLFSTKENMVGPKTLSKITKFLAKNNGREVNIVLHTPGGYVFYAQQIAHMLKENNVVAYVPVMSMSAGTLMALSCNKVVMGKQATLGPVDPQLGFFWGVRSSRSYKETVHYKGTNVDDSTYGFYEEGKKCEKEIFNQLMNNIKAKNPRKAALKLTDGDYTHGARFTIEKLKEMGIENIMEMKNKEYEVTTKLF